MWGLRIEAGSPEKAAHALNQPLNPLSSLKQGIL